MDTANRISFLAPVRVRASARGMRRASPQRFHHTLERLSPSGRSRQAWALECKNGIWVIDIRMDELRRACERV